MEETVRDRQRERERQTGRERKKLRAELYLVYGERAYLILQGFSQFFPRLVVPDECRRGMIFYKPDKVTIDLRYPIQTPANTAEQANDHSIKVDN